MMFRRHRPNLKKKEPRPEGLRFVALETVTPAKITKTDRTPTFRGKLAWSSTRSSQAAFHVRIPQGVEPAQCFGIFSADQTVMAFPKPILLGAGHEFVCDPNHPIRLERFGNRMPDLFAGFEPG